MTAKKKFEALRNEKILLVNGLGQEKTDFEFLVTLIEAAVELLKEADATIALEYAAQPDTDEEIWQEIEERMAARGKGK